MPNATVRANAQTMPEQTMSPHEIRVEVGNVVDTLAKVKQLQSAGLRLIEELPMDDREPHATVLYVAQSEIHDAYKRLDAVQGHMKGTPPAAEPPAVNGAADGRATPGEIAERETFEAAYSGWLAARAATADPGGDNADQVRDRIYFAEREAEMRLIKTAAPISWQVLQKLELVDHLVAEETEGPLTLLALASVRADLMAIGNGGEGA